MIDALIGSMATELHLTAEEIADIFWLTHIRQQSGETLPSRTPISSGTTHAPSGGSDRWPESKQDSGQQEEASADDAQSSHSSPDQIGITPPPPTDNHTDIDTEERDANRHRVKLPDAPSLRDPLSLMRALRPLIHPVSAPDRTSLDEKATVQKIAEEQIWMLVTKPEQEPWLDLALVVDESNSMLIWRHTVLEIQRLLRYHGAFRDVRTWGLVPDPDNPETMAIRPRLGVAASHLSVRRPQELIDPNGRRLVLVVTDCVSQAWQTGRVVSTLETWARQGPTAILQMLPERLWPRTALRKAVAVELMGCDRGVANQKLRVFRQTIRGTVEERRQEVKIPVFSLEPELMALWSQMVAGRGGNLAVGYLWQLSLSHYKQSQEIPEPAAAIDPQQRLKDFLRSSTPIARHLARLLAASPVVTLPVIRLIQETMLPESDQVHVAEVLLGGLFEPATPPQLGVNPDQVRYRFVDESLRDLLLKEASRLDVKDVLSRYISRKLGRTLQQFMAEWQTLSQREDQTKGEQEQPFAVVAASVLQRLGRQYTEFVQQVQTHYGVQILPGLPSSLESGVILPGATGEALQQQIATLFKPKQVMPPQRARDMAFTIDSSDRQQSLSCLYTGYTIRRSRGKSLRPLEQGLNADRLWPRSKGGGDQIQGDLHNTFPSRIQVNSARGNAPFCELTASEVHSWFRDEQQLTHPPSDLSLWGQYSKLGDVGFEPRDAVKGIVARALLYVYTIYRDQLQPNYFEQQRPTLLKWHQQYPPTEQERQRSHKVTASAQGNGNPFVLDPTLAERIYGAIEEDAEPPVTWKTDTVIVATIAELETVEFPVATVTVEEEELRESLPLTTFNFEIGKVEPSGSDFVVKRQPGQAQQWVEDLGNGVTLEMVWIPGGEFWMGSAAGEGDADERPQHRVTVQPFLIGKYPITQNQWKAVAALPKVDRDLDFDPSRFKGANRPVERVSWHDAVEFCLRLSRHTGRNYRLPSEAEWEYACRAGTDTAYHFGPQLIREVANFDGNKTTEVGSFGVANAFGLYDLHGNVWEWCQDVWHESYEGAPIDGSAWVEGGDQSLRVLRGGSWYDDPRNCRSANRLRVVPGSTYNDNGFRVVCSAP